MIVCSCRAVSDRSLREAAAHGLSHREVVARTHAGTDCGRCSKAVARIVAESSRPGPSCEGCVSCPGHPGS